MPRLDKTGPAGQGPLTGRGMGSCANGAVYPCRFGGYGRGVGRFKTNEDYVKALKDEIEMIQEEIADVGKDQK